eukprot:Phypoly_transcript_03413.p1 GENE.Phypoly_transcript_03413~~Phypoly_transcript_03413.p1  ORF type:complete len:400 (+),score=33.04 Phypoly_transcript_03413:251-1450(+)
MNAFEGNVEQGKTPPLDQMLNVYDFKAVAKNAMTKDAWDYYESAADDELCAQENRVAFHRIWLRPRILVDVSNIDMSCSMLGYKMRFPLYICPTAVGKLAHKDGELALARAAHTRGILQMVPTMASYSLEEITAERKEGLEQWFQLYLNPNREASAELIRRAEKAGCKGLVVTVDLPLPGKRERDMRNKAKHAPSVQKTAANANKGYAVMFAAMIDPDLKWADVAWLRSITKLPIILKGIQTGEDAVLAVKYGVPAIVVSNHGGRQLDFARSAIEVLMEVMEHLKAINAQDKIEVYMDGGVRRGSDIFKALALGAKAVGIGRPALYGLGGYGQAGVERVIDLLRGELEMTMRLAGTPSIKDINPNMVITKQLNQHVTRPAKDYFQSRTYEKMESMYSKL